MDWKYFWNQLGNEDQPLAQVARRGGVADQNDRFFEEYAAYIAAKIYLNKDDILLDLCCGNGLITNYFKPYCKEVIGVDFSQQHIESANRNYANQHIHFFCGDVSKLNEIKELNSFKITKSTLCFSFQYFESVLLGKRVIEQALALMHDKGVLFLSDIPDAEKWFIYYNSPIKLLRLLKQFIMQNNDMGKFWSEKELEIISTSIKASGIKIQQPAHFPYHHYRMDYLIKKNV